MGRLRSALAVAGAMCIPASVALAPGPASAALASGHGYSLHVSAPGSVGRGKAFTITGKGSAKKRVRLVVFLAAQKCSSSYVLEYNDIGAWQLGDPYFRRGRGKGSKSLVSKAYAVRGAFNVSVTAHAGTHAGTQYVCAYLPSSNPSVTRAHASTTYRVR